MQTKPLPVIASARRSPNVATEVDAMPWREVGAPAAAPARPRNGAAVLDAGIAGSDLKHGFRLGAWEVRPLSGEISGADVTLHVEPKVMEVLLLLARRPGEVVERDDLLTRIWGPRAAVSDEPLTRCIAVLRRVLDDSPRTPVYIQTIPKRGYRLLASVTTLAAPEPGHPHNLSREPDDARSIAESSIPENSIAVLPFMARSTAADVLDFGGELAGEIRSRLLAGNDLLVVARTWSDAAGVSRDLRTLRTQLRVALVLEGRVQRNGDQLRIHVDLCDAQSGYLIWSASFEDALTTASYFAIQDRIATAIVTKLRESLAPSPNTIALARARRTAVPKRVLAQFVIND